MPKISLKSSNTIKSHNTKKTRTQVFITKKTKDEQIKSKDAKDIIPNTKSKSTSKIVSHNNTFNKYITPFNTDIIRPKIWELPNRKRFYDWVLTTFGKYESGNLIKKSKEHKKIKSTKNLKQKINTTPISNEQHHLNNIQRLTRDFMQGTSPNRGLLLYIGLGAGKTGAAVAIAEAINTKKQVIILSKTSLENNFRKEILKWGADYMKTSNHWIFNKCNTPEEMDFATDILNIPRHSINENNGAFFIDFTNSKPNYNELSSVMKEKLRIQINHLIDVRFKFLHYDNTRLIGKLTDDEFDNKVVIVDEIHNLGNTMISVTSKSGPRYYELFMNAKNPKFVFLSATPLVNQVFEATRLFNILRGYMPSFTVKFKTTFDTNINYDNLKYLLAKNKFVDQVLVNKHNKIIKVSKNPDYFITHPDGKGIIYSDKPNDLISLDEFEQQIKKLIELQGYKIAIERKMETCLPETKLEFEQKFYNPDLNKLKRIDLIKRRIAGLTSYYEYQDKTKYPKLLPINRCQIPMSVYQFGVYERYRHQELEKERNKKKKTKDDEQTSSSYRLKSRLACTFVFPDETGSPYDTDKDLQQLEKLEILGDTESQFDTIHSDIEDLTDKETKQLEKQIKLSYLRLLEKNKEKYLDITNGSLLQYSPKYYEMIRNIAKSGGKILVYSYFKVLIGLNTFSYALMQTGKWAEFKIKKVKNEWELDENENDTGKMKFLFYTGNEDNDVREIYRNVYNSTWDLLPASCDKLVRQLKEQSTNNYYGEVVKMLMTTRAGAEGLDLREVRQIHIMEPYWQPVLIDQVIGRGVRNESHLKLPEQDRNVEVFIYMATITPTMVSKISYTDVRMDTYKYSNPALADKKGRVVSSDEYLYILAERKKLIINEFQKLMKDSAFDCALNYHDNKLNPINENIICLDYATKNRDEYLFTPALEDTLESIDLAQEKIVSIPYEIFTYKGKKYYYPKEANVEGKIYIYDESFIGRIRLPKPVGEIKSINGKLQKVMYKKKMAK